MKKLLLIACSLSFIACSGDDGEESTPTHGSGKSDFFGTGSDANFEVGRCIERARACTFSRLDSGGPAATFATCLEGAVTEQGSRCDAACDADEDARFLCDSLIEALSFYAEEGDSCAGEFDTCMTECVEFGAGAVDGSAVYETPVAYCFDGGATSYCDSFARRMPTCGGDLTHEDAQCFEGCFAREGAFLENPDEACTERCGSCGLACGRQLNAFVDPPNDGLVGDVIDSFEGSIEGLGDVCLFYVEVLEDGDGEFAPGTYGIFGSVDLCPTGDWSSLAVGDALYITADELTEMSGSDLEALQSHREAATYFEFYGEWEELSVYTLE